MFNIFTKISFALIQTSPPHIKSKITKLTDRSLLILQGPDSHKLLQGITTCDIRQIKAFTFQNQTIHRIAAYTLFLLPKSKILTDAFIIQPRMRKKGVSVYCQNQYWIDVDKSVKKDLISHLGRYMWKKSVQLIDTEEEAEDGHYPKILSIYKENNPCNRQVLGCSIELQQMDSGEDDTYNNLMYFDPRGQQFGLRIISSSEHIDVKGSYDQISLQERSNIFRQFGQLPLKMIRDKLPFQYNFDLLHAISLKKGCYIGQELVSRSLMTGIIRKRVFPFQITSKGDKIQNNGILRNSNGEQLGKILSIDEKGGFALSNYLNWIQKDEWKGNFVSPCQGVLLNPFNNALKQYYNQMRLKQQKLDEIDL